MDAPSERLSMGVCGECVSACRRGALSISPQQGVYLDEVKRGFEQSRQYRGPLQMDAADKERWDAQVMSGGTHDQRASPRV